MPLISKQAQAEQDLLDIWLYTFKTWGERQADQYLDSLSEALELLAEQPLACRERQEFIPPVRIHHHQHHLVVYLAKSDGIQIVRVLHDSMDVDSALADVVPNSC